MRISRGITRSRANGNGMSAMEGIARMPSPDEIAAGGSVIPLHHGSPPVGQVQPSTSAAPDLGPVSPELALIDPELARAARERLPDPPRPVPLAEQPVRIEPRGTSLAAGSGARARTASPPRPTRPARIRCGSHCARGAAHAGRRSRGTTRPRRAADSVGRARGLPAEGHGHRAGAHNTHALKPAKPAGTSPTPATSAPSHATAVPGQTFVWVAAPDAAAYEFQLFQGGERVFRARVQEARLELPGRWRQDGRPHALLPGSYRWYVWMISKRTKQQSAKPTVSAKLVVAKQAR